MKNIKNIDSNNQYKGGNIMKALLTTLTVASFIFLSGCVSSYELSSPPYDDTYYIPSETEHIQTISANTSTQQNSDSRYVTTHILMEQVFI